jgi:leucyl-tRNA synthetase
MTQWSMRISAYAERLLQGLNEIDWTESLKESQRNWIGKSVGATVEFRIQNSEFRISVFTTRPDTIFGVTFMTLAPEHDLVAKITTPEQKEAVEAYVHATAKRSERERMADVKTISGVFTGAYAEHPFTKELVPVWIGDYVLAGYGTGAVMAVPCGDERDYAFANYFKGKNGMPEIKNIFDQDISEEAFGAKEGFKLVDSDFLNGLGYKEGTKKAIEALENIKQGNGKINYRLRDAVFSRQRYWGEPFPVYYVNGLPQMIDKKYLPIALPEVEKYLPTEDGQPPLGNATVWAWDSVQCKVVSNQLIDNKTIFPLELNTMPGWAGSSWYWMRYMDAHNEEEFASKEALDYWQNVDLYIGGSEHATGHLLYARFWNKFLKDRGFAPTEEPFKKLINQGMILGMSAFVYKVQDFIAKSKDEILKINLLDKLYVVSHSIINNPEKLREIFIKVSKNNPDNPALQKIVSNIENFELELKTNPIHVDLSVINDITNELNIDDFLSNPLYADFEGAEFMVDNGKYIVGREVEKMSKSKYNVVSPDEICNEYGADTLRLYEMFLGPLEQAKPWNTAGITGVFGFLKKLWRLYFDDNCSIVTNDEPTAEMYKSLHKTIKKVTEDIENFSFNTSVSQFMICVNELATLKCHHRAILEPLAIVISPYAPHIAEELWFRLQDSKIEELKDYKGISKQPFPIFDPKYLVESEKEYPVSFNGKMRFTIKLSLDLTPKQIEEIVMADERTITQLAGNTPKKVIIIPGKIINLVG